MVYRQMSHNLLRKATAQRMFFSNDDDDNDDDDDDDVSTQLHDRSVVH
jgi:hypothetical protein